MTIAEFRMYVKVIDLWSDGVRARYGTDRPVRAPDVKVIDLWSDGVRPRHVADRSPECEALHNYTDRSQLGWCSSNA